MKLKQWLRFFKIGDWLIIGIAINVIFFSYKFLWFEKDQPDMLFIFVKNQEIKHEPLKPSRLIKIQGILGETIIETDAENHRVRIIKDPSPRQYCVLQGWINRSGNIAMCLPNQVMIEVTSSLNSQKNYDSIGY